MWTHLALFALAPAQAADCVVDALESRVRFADGVAERQDAWTLGAEPGATACRLLVLPPVPGMDLVAISGRIGRPDRRRVRFGAERLSWDEGPAWSEPVTRIHLPDADIGSTIDLALTWRGAADTLAWHPAALGPVGVASLTVEGGSVHAGARPLPGGPAWSWADVPAGQSPLQIHRMGAGAPRPGPARPAPPVGPTAPAGRPAGTVSHRIALLPDVSADVGPDEPPRGRAGFSGAWDGPDGAPPLLVRAPTGATGLACSTGAEAGLAVAGTCRFPAGVGVRRWSWGLDGLPVAGSLALQPDGAGRGLAAVQPATGEVVWTLHGAGLPAEVVRPAAGADGPGVRSVAEDRLAWRVATVGGQPVLPDRATAVERIALLGIRASMPEPGLPLRYKHRVEPDDLLDEILSLVRVRVRAAPPIGRGPLSPRPLVSVLRAGWGTAWEQALLLTRYLRQLKVEAVPVPVRPRSAGAGDPASPEGHTAAVVRVEQAGAVRWVAPACVLCAVDELPSDLHEAPALSAVLDRLPPASLGGVHVEALEDGGSRVTLDGAAARALRETLLASRPADRIAAVPAWVGAPGAALVSHAGLAAPGAPVVLVLDGAATGPALPRVGHQGSREVVLPWAGIWRWTPPPPGAGTEPFDNGVVAWDVSGGSATLTVATPVAARGAAAAGLDTARRRLGR